jgi:hypothetical protein
MRVRQDDLSKELVSLLLHWPEPLERPLGYVNHALSRLHAASTASSCGSLRAAANHAAVFARVCDNELARSSSWRWPFCHVLPQPQSLPHVGFCRLCTRCRDQLLQVSNLAARPGSGCTQGSPA